MVLSVRRSVEEPARQLAAMSRARQERFLQAVEYISRQTNELAFNFCMFGLDGLEPMEEELWRTWVDHLLDVYDEGGVLKAITAMGRVEAFVDEHHRRHGGALRLEDAAGVLGRFVTGLSGRDLKLSAGSDVYTDTELLYLPESARRFQRREDNYRLYKATAAHLWAQTWFGTWRSPVAERIARFSAPGAALEWFHALETARLDACLRRELPGLWRDMAALLALCGEAAPDAQLPEAVRQALQEGCAAVDTTWRLLPELAAQGSAPAPVCYQGGLFPERTEAAQQRRQRQERDALQTMLADLVDTRERCGAPPAHSGADVELQQEPGPDPGGPRFSLRVHGEAVTPPQEVQRTLASIQQDFGHVPADWLLPAGPGGYRAQSAADARDETPASDRGTLLYDEWDHVRGHYRRNWC